MSRRVSYGTQPFISDSLLKRLRDAFPDKMPTKGTSHDEILFSQGALSVIHFIEQQIEEDED